MVTWILGRSGVGKTTALKEQLAALAVSYKKIYFISKITKHNYINM